MRSGLVLVYVLAVALCAAGCASHKMTMETKPGIAATTADVRTPTPLVVTGVEMQARKSDSSEYKDFPAPPKLVKYLVKRLRETGRFSKVYEPDQAKDAPADSVRLRLKVQETVGYGGGAFAKAVVVGLTFCLTEPLFWIECTGQCVMRATVSLPDGRERTYKAQTDGVVAFNYFYGFGKALRQTDAAVISNAFGSILSQMRNDAELAMLAKE